MARSFLHATIAIILTCSILRAKAQINTPCSSSMISTFTPCMNFVTGSSGTGSSPTEECCDSLKSLMTGNMDCVCLIVTGNVPVSIPFINASLALSLPQVCKNSVPLQCRATGVPLPPPGPVLFGPTPAPAPSRATQARARAPAPTGPISLGPAPAPHSHSPKASKEKAVAATTTAPPPVEISEAAPVASPPKFPLGPSTNSGIRPVVNPNSASSRYTAPSLSFVLIMYLGFQVVLIKFLIM